jgi:hypothetical protein
VKALVVIMIFFCFATLDIKAHPVHVSVCNIEFNIKGSTITIKLFSDDFGTVLRNKFNEEFVPSRADEKPFRDYIANYVNSNLKITINRNRSLLFNYDYSEVNEGAIWLYFKTDKLYPVEKIKVENTLMLDLYEDQTNLVIVNFNGKQEGFRYNYKVRELDIDLK